jgi:hypothetical protein
MTINADINQMLLTERIADLRREADQERIVRAARITRPRRRHAPPRPWWRRLARRWHSAGHPARLA